jgi:hypothetical protein
VILKFAVGAGFLAGGLHGYVSERALATTRAGLLALAATRPEKTESLKAERLKLNEAGRKLAG